MLAVIFIGCLQAHARADEKWSEQVNNIRARLCLESDPKSSFLKVFVEFQNVADFMGSIKIRFKPEHLRLEVKDSKDHSLEKPGSVNYSGMKPLWEPLLLPFEGNLRFRVSFPGFGTKQGNSRTIIDLDPGQIWVLPEQGEYFLSGKLTVPEHRGDHPSLDWSGTLVLPTIKIPRSSWKPSTTSKSTSP
jgi:hypothetical protein